METTSKFILPGILLLLALAFGFWLSRVGKPYNGVLFNIHKLIALASVIFAELQIYNLFKGGHIPVVLVIALVTTAFFIVVLFFSGAMMSAGQLNQAAMLTIHRIAIALELISLAAVIYLLNGLNS